MPYYYASKGQPDAWYMIALDCCRCGQRLILSRKDLERYERESKVILCDSCKSILKDC